MENQKNSRNMGLIPLGSIENHILELKKQSTDKFSGDSIRVNTTLAGILATAAFASFKMKALGPKKLEQIKNLTLDKYTDFIDPAVASCQLYYSPLYPSVPADTVKYAIRTFRTYKTLLKYQDKAEQLRRIQEIEEIIKS
ncbi:hypothetical protein FJZ20_00705 [Candidatus Pacearchaeota archaeon]|nr:hypothetical protein [Candidatus Pacearchaeota archaeon]